MDKVKLISNESFTQYGTITRLLMEGADLSRFNDNPVMLHNHNYDKVIGQWKDIEVSDEGILATPEFDEDEDSLKLKAKFEKGSLKGASIGIEVKDAYFEGEELIISEWEVLEASLTPVPADPSALKQFSFSYKGSQIRNFNKFAKNTKGEVVEEGEVVETEVTEVVVDEVVETEVTVSEVDVDPIDNTTNELEDSNVIVLDEVVQPIVNDEVNPLPSVEDEVLRATIEDLTNKLAEKEAELQLAFSKVSSLEAIIEIEKTEVINKAISLSKITKEDVGIYTDLSFSKVKEVLNSIKIPNVISLNKVINNETAVTDGKDYSWYLKNDKKGLAAMEKAEPSKFNHLQQEFLKKVK